MECKTNSSIDEMIELEGFRFRKTVFNKRILDFKEEMTILIEDLREGVISDFRIVPSYNTPECSGLFGKEEAHSIYVKD
jgi:hypothetical protein